jgi:predicted nucleic acid-binding protein
MGLLVKQGANELTIDTADELIAATLLTQGGRIVHPNFQS